MSRLKEIKKQVYEGNILLSKEINCPQFAGNLSIIDRNNDIISIKPSNIPFNKLSVENMVVLDSMGNIIDAPLTPSVDTKLHVYLYKQFKKINSIVHTHSKFATAWAQTENRVTCLGTMHADYALGDIPCTRVLTKEELGTDYEINTAKSIVGEFNGLRYLDIPMVLVARHGPFTWGKNYESAIFHMKVLESICETAFISKLIKPDISRLNEDYIGHHFCRKQKRLKRWDI